jgi:uncharacterized protein YqeY
VADIRERLRARLKERMVARDRTAVQAIRVALAAIENAEAQPMDAAGQTERQLAATTATDVPRRVVTDEDARGLVAVEADDLEAAARRYQALGEADAASTAAAQAEVLRQALGP